MVCTFGEKAKIKKAGNLNYGHSSVITTVQTFRNCWTPSDKSWNTTFTMGITPMPPTWIKYIFSWRIISFGMIQFMITNTYHVRSYGRSGWYHTTPFHSVSKCPISFGNWFWHLIVGNRSIVLNFYQQRPVFALKNHPRPQRPKRPMKANKGQHSPKLQIYMLLSLINVKSSINVNIILKKCVFKKLEIFILIT